MNVDRKNGYSPCKVLSRGIELEICLLLQRVEQNVFVFESEKKIVEIIKENNIKGMQLYQWIHVININKVNISIRLSVALYKAGQDACAFLLITNAYEKNLASCEMIYGMACFSYMFGDLLKARMVLAGAREKTPEMIELLAEMDEKNGQLQ